MSNLKAVIFGAIGAVVETSDLQRQAFNLAFEAAGINWYWDPQMYKDLLNTNGGQSRLRRYADANTSGKRIPDSLVASLHAEKTRQFVKLLKQTKLQPRPGVRELMNDCKREETEVAFCTSTSMDNVAGIAEAVSDALDFEQFSVVVTIDKIKRAKPAPDAYLYCLDQLKLSRHEVVAIEDTPVSTSAAKAAGIFTLATPGATTSQQDFSEADWVVKDLSGITVKHLAATLRVNSGHVLQRIA